ncbi:hypothetical protein JTB14_029200 [Gonioctena quinquepunctata]|nr:hypothetical protein JTB14_029200 [Gonioctena quinquepunctata]
MGRYTGMNIIQKTRANQRFVVNMKQFVIFVNKFCDSLNDGNDGLFRAALMESQSPLACFSLNKYPEIAAHQYVDLLKRNSKSSGATLGSKNTTSEEALKILQKATLADMKKYSDNITIPLNKMNCHSLTSLIWVPVYENDRNKDALITGMNHENIKYGKINKVPMLIGINSEEALLGGQVIQQQCVMLDDNPSAIVTQNMDIKKGDRIPAGRTIKRMYTQSSFASTPAAPFNYATDMLFATPVARHAYLQSKYTDVFFYQFSHLGKLGRLVNLTIEGAIGVAHQEEVEYLFRTDRNKDLNKFPAEDILTHDRLVELWSQFIKYMNPTEKPTAILHGIVWPKVSQKKFSYLNINTTLTVLEDPKKYKEYSRIYSQYGEQRLDTY